MLRNQKKIKNKIIFYYLTFLSFKLSFLLDFFLGFSY